MIKAYGLGAFLRGRPTATTSGTMIFPPGVEKLLTRVKENTLLQIFIGRADIYIGSPIEVKCFSPEDVTVLSTTSTDIGSLSSSAIFCVGEGDLSIFQERITTVLQTMAIMMPFYFSP